MGRAESLHRVLPSWVILKEESTSDSSLASSLGQLPLPSVHTLAKQTFCPMAQADALPNFLLATPIPVKVEPSSGLS